MSNPFAPREYGSLEQVTDRVYIYRNIVNTGVFVGDKGIAVVDTQVNHALAKRVVAAIQRQFNKPILYAVNTRYHWDHTNGNEIFKQAGATLLAGRETAKAMVERAPRQKPFLASRGFELGPDPLQPDAFVEDVKSIDLGGLSLLFQAGHPAETADPTLSWCPEERVMAAGDTVMTGSFPIFGQPSQNEGLQNDDWLAALAEIQGFGPEAILPGHGPVARDEEMAMLEKICRYFLRTVRQHHADGLNLEQTIATMEEDMPAWITKIPEVWGTPRYAILRVWAGLEDLGQPGWQHVKPSAIPRDEADARAAAAGIASEDASTWIETAAQAMEGGDTGQAVSLLEQATEGLPAGTRRMDGPWQHSD